MNDFVKFMKDNAKDYLNKMPAVSAAFYVANELFFEKDEYVYYDVNEIAYNYLMSSKYRDDFISKMYDKFSKQSKSEETFIDRLIVEYNELCLKTAKLQCFLESKHYVSKYQEALLQLQLSTMLSYAKILRLRLENLTEPEENKNVNSKSNKRK